MFGKGSRKLETIVGNDTRIAGKASVKGTIRVDGIVDGDVQADRVVVGETGKILGNTRTRGMVVGGSDLRIAGPQELPGRPVRGSGPEVDVEGPRGVRPGGAESAGIQEGNVRPLIPTKAGV